MDAIDRKILAELQQNGRLTVTELAERVQLSVSPCHRRLRDLERDGIISGYRATLDFASVGLGFDTMVFVTMSAVTTEALTAFEEGVKAIPNIIQAQRLIGTPDYQLRVVAEDLADYQRLYDEKLIGLPGVQLLSTALVMKNVVLDRPLPI